jgi:2-keto-3-deoxy-L-rhamnonate aldolase RhmA
MSPFDAINNFRSRLDAGEVCLGSGVTTSDPVVMEVLAPVCDFIWIDLEHTHLGYESLMGHLIAARACETPAIVRVRDGQLASIKPVLDMGVDGFVVPQVRSAAEVKSIVDMARYAPLGQRGYGPRRAGRYGMYGGREYADAANESLFAGVQVENTDAFAELDDILSIEGLDTIFIGPYDLSVSMGHFGEVDHPEVRETIQTIIDRTRAAGKYVGIGMDASAAGAMKAIRQGVQWVQCGDDYGHMRLSFESVAREVRG